MKKALFAALLLVCSLGLFAQKGSNMSKFNQKIAGAWLAVSPQGSQLMQIFADGNLSFELSAEFPGNNNFKESFSNPVGEWQATGKQTIRVKSLDLVMDGSGKFIGVSVSTNTVRFDDKFQVATVDCQGVLYAPGVDPFAKGAQPIPGSEFSCGSMEFHRIPKY